MKPEKWSKSNHPNFGDSDLLHPPKPLKSRQEKVTCSGFSKFWYVRFSWHRWFHFQGHNSKPGPVYAGGGYTPMSKALRFGPKAIAPLLEKYPELVNEVSTGGASPLHMCGK